MNKYTFILQDKEIKLDILIAISEADLSDKDMLNDLNTWNLSSNRKDLPQKIKDSVYKLYPINFGLTRSILNDDRFSIRLIDLDCIYRV